MWHFLMSSRSWAWKDPPRVHIHHLICIGLMEPTRNIPMALSDPHLSNRSPSSHWTWKKKLHTIPHSSSWCSLIFPSEMPILDGNQPLPFTSTPRPIPVTTLRRVHELRDAHGRRLAIGRGGDAAPVLQMCIPAGKWTIKICTKKRFESTTGVLYLYMHMSCYMSKTTQREVSRSMTVWQPRLFQKRSKSPTSYHVSPQTSIIHWFPWVFPKPQNLPQFRPHLHLHLLRQLHGSPWPRPLRQRGAAQDLREHRGFAVQRLGARSGRWENATWTRFITCIVGIDMDLSGFVWLYLDLSGFVWIWHGFIWICLDL